MNKYKALSSQGFFDESGDDDDLDDFAFLNHPKQGSGYVLASSHSSDSSRARAAEKKQEQLMDEMENIQNRTLASSKRALGLVHESEQIGISTAEDLLKQREQLENCEKRVTDINSSLRVSQKHITSIQSIFAGFKNIFSKTPSTVDTPTSSSSKVPEDKAEMKKTSATLGFAVDTSKSQPHYKPAVHPGLKIRGLDEDDDDDDDDFPNRASSAAKGRSTTYKVQEQLDQNLDDLNMGISRLKGLALGLGDEITEQNDLIDKVMKGTEKADIGLERQNKQMKKILNK